MAGKIAHPKSSNCQPRKTKTTIADRAIGSSDNTLINMHLTAQFPVTLSVQNARGDSLGTCYYAQITGVAANCSIRWDNMPKYIVVEDPTRQSLWKDPRAERR